MRQAPSARRDRACRSRFESSARFEPLECRALLTAGPRVTSVVVGSSQWSNEFVSYLQSAQLGRGGYAVPGGSATQLKSLPWSTLNRVSIQFDQPVTIDRNSLAVTGVNTKQALPEDFDYDNATRVATWTFATPLTGDRLLLDLASEGLSPVRNFEGSRLDGDWFDGVSIFRSGNGQQGNDFEFRVNVLPGDATQANSVTANTYTTVANSLGRTTADADYSPFYDVDGSGTIDSTDLQYVSLSLGTRLPLGNPAGLLNNAPSGTASQAVSVENAADFVFSLWDAFDDVETSDGQLQFRVVSNSNTDLVLSTVIDDAQGTLSVTLDPGMVGSAAIGVEAVDTGGLKTGTTIGVEVVGDNNTPQIEGFVADGGNAPTWVFSGRVTDENPGGRIVVFGGLLDGQTATTNEDGTFSITVQITGIGTVSAQTMDPQGSTSPPVYVVINNIEVDPPTDPRHVPAPRDVLLAPTATPVVGETSSDSPPVSSAPSAANRLAARLAPRTARRLFALLPGIAFPLGEKGLG